MNLKGKNAIVTGGSRGIGRAIALGLAENGANVMINYTSNKEAAEAVVREMEGYGVKALAVQCNVTNSDDVKKMVEIAEENFDTIDVLVNNAGITKDNLLLRMKEEEWQQVMDVNLKGVFLCTKAIIRKMMKQKQGKIINISSVVGVVGNAGQANYAASKAGVIGFTKSVAREVAGKNIHVNAIAPGFIDTDMTAVLSEDIKNGLIEGIPLKRYGKPEDIAALVTFLSSDLANYITGQVIHVDGGMAI
ncbi:3-oxoacyl-[acyl-carrier-protein] reductase [Clostridium formicaceticum]|uniref:3-oxoacyl-[acyl-carrier-protein] reductase n=1 Tax=Clostridium formicaceticum TaxID=1497 RepID=A0AAC9RLK4_9CLOT|nr:3-oxoacyl-[acyl-carrier-protein] reductase [Clostridium formicaceticum]AOY77348.1 3-oxoacyl-[acyl-carrier-protein] reductase [Clostridium formicaceticum]ARE87892.1 3-oxoacyl-[acyl-carrier-protein] reductase FabG [Clostridium formicaceticum]